MDMRFLSLPSEHDGNVKEGEQPESDLQAELKRLDRSIERLHPKDSATEEALAIISKRCLEKVLSNILERSVAKGNDPDLVWFANRVAGALEVQKDPARLPY